MPFEIQPRLDFLGQDFCEGLVEAGEHFHGGLGLDTAFLDEFVQSVDEGEADAAAAVDFPVGLVVHGGVRGGDSLGEGRLVMVVAVVFDYLKA